MHNIVGGTKFVFFNRAKASFVVESCLENTVRESYIFNFYVNYISRRTIANTGKHLDG